MAFPWIHESEMQAARAEARLEAEGAFEEGRRLYLEDKQRIEAGPEYRQYFGLGEPEAGS